MLDSRIRKRERLRLTELVDSNGVLTDHTFVGCRIDGPAIVLTPESRFEGCQLGDVNAIFWPIETRATVSGVVVLLHCLFEGCTFYNVGFAGSTAEVERWRDGLLPSEP
jgi:hypothetical protein